MRYLVVSHSGAELGAVTVYVILRSSTVKLGQTLCIASQSMRRPVRFVRIQGIVRGA